MGIVRGGAARSDAAALRSTVLAAPGVPDEEVAAASAAARAV
jgi:hypothetical protein